MKRFIALKALAPGLPALLVLIACLIAQSACQPQGSPSDDIRLPADQVYLNGAVITVDESNTVAEALAVRDGRIVAVGTRAEVTALAGPDTDTIDLTGQAVLPGFIDSHSHLSVVGTTLDAANLSPPPAGEVASIVHIQSALKAVLESTTPEDDAWIVGWGYDHSMLAEQRHPTRADLDQISTQHAIVAIHFSLHQAVLNSRALERLGYSAASLDPPGGVIQRRSGTTEPNGIVEEAAWLPVWNQLLKPSAEDQLRQIIGALQLYVSQGFTTVQDGGLMSPAAAVFDTLYSRGELPVDVIGYAYQPAMALFGSEIADRQGYQNRFRYGGVKLVLDGGSPGRTAYLRDPYHVQLQGESGYRGYPHIADQDQINALVNDTYARDLPLNIHALGDAAIDQAIAAIRQAELSNPAGERRTNLIHLQLLRKDQLDALRQLDVTLTFQVAHNFYFGDLHRRWTMGPDRAANLNPARWALEYNLPFTIHHDAPVHPVDQMMLIWTAVNRVTRSGHVLGAHQRIGVMDAIRASTINAAFQYFEEKVKGSIEVGKLADLVILSDNPLTVDSMALKDLKIVATIKEGQTIYSRQ